MRALTTASALSLLVLSIGSVGLAGCAGEEEGTDAQASGVTGGTGPVEAPVLYLFDDVSRVGVKCVGTMLGDRVAVTAKSCAREGMIAGRAADRAGRGFGARVSRVHVPPEADAEIAVIELDRALGGTHAVITHAPLRTGYLVNGVATSASPYDPFAGRSAAIGGSLVEETSTSSVVVPNMGSEICETDIGAPVCATSEARLGGLRIAGTCGMAGLVVGQVEPPVANPAPTPGAPAPVPAPVCSGKGWKVAQLGRYADFIRPFAPRAFQPIVINRDFFNDLAFVPDGLWGYRTRGDVRACRIETPTLASIDAGAWSTPLSARVRFASMDRYAAAYGRFGIAPKSDPTNVRWFPARATAPTYGAAFEATFEGVVGGMPDGEYVVSFRATPSGGERWVECDLDGIDNGFQVEQTVQLLVGTAALPQQPEPAPEPEPATPAPVETTPQDSSGGYTDPAPGDDSGSAEDFGEVDSDYSELEGGDTGSSGRKLTTSGCSASPSPLSGASALPLAAGALGLALAARRRRRR